MKSHGFEEIFTLIAMSLWFLFPLGMFIAILRLDSEEKKSSITKTEKPQLKTFHLFTQIESKPENYIYAEDEYNFDEDEDEDEDDTEDYKYVAAGASTHQPEKDAQYY